MQIDQFESQFKRAVKERFKFEPIEFSSIALVSGLNSEEVASPKAMRNSLIRALALAALSLTRVISRQSVGPDKASNSNPLVTAPMGLISLDHLLGCYVRKLHLNN